MFKKNQEQVVQDDMQDSKRKLANTVKIGLRNLNIESSGK